MAPRIQGPPQHRHARHDEGFYILFGTVRFNVGYEEAYRYGPRPARVVTLDFDVTPADRSALVPPDVVQAGLRRMARRREAERERRVWWVRLDAFESDEAHRPR